MVHAELRQEFYRALSEHYQQGELQSLYHWCVQEIEGWNRAEAYLQNERTVAENRLSTWKAVITRLIRKEPVQYIFNKASFFGLELYVDDRVLIPRPETEELVHLVLQSADQNKELSILDVGTGSGCIALALASARPTWQVSGWDVSIEALEVARRNGSELDLRVAWEVKDIGDSLSLDGIDIIVSNPPYIPVELKGKLDRTVEGYEPSLALFAPADEPLYFFKRIVALGLASGVRQFFFETHATDFDQWEVEVSPLHKGKETFVRDLEGKARFVHIEA